MQTTQPKAWAFVDRAGDFKGLVRRTCAGAVIANVEIDQKIDGARGGGFIPFDLLRMIDDRHRAGGGDTRDLRGIGKRRREQDAGNPVFGHQFGLGDGRDGDSARAMSNLTPRNLDALMRLGVWSELLAGFLHALRHACQVQFEKIEIEEQRGRRDLLFREHRSIMSDAI